MTLARQGVGDVCIHVYIYTCISSGRKEADMGVRDGTTQSSTWELVSIQHVLKEAWYRDSLPSGAWPQGDGMLKAELGS